MHRRKESLSWIGKPCIHLPSCNFAQVCLVFIFISHCDRNLRRQLAPCALSLRAEEPGSDSESLNLGSCHNLFTLVCVYKKQSKTKQNPKAKPSLTRRKNLERNTTRGSWLYVTSGLWTAGLSRAITVVVLRFHCRYLFGQCRPNGQPQPVHIYLGCIHASCQICPELDESTEC